MNKLRTLMKEIDWINVAFLTLTPIIAFGGTAYLVSTNAIHWATVVLAVVMAIFAGLGITAGYHRMFSHGSYNATWPYRLFMVCFGAAAFENSALKWSSDHRIHHKFVDTPQDPYNINRGFFYAHMGWVMLKGGPTVPYNNVEDLEKDPIVMWQHRNYVKIGLFFGLALPTMIAALWGDALGGFFIAGFLRTVMNHHFTFSINSFAHLVGKQPYSDRDSSRDSWWLAFVTYGEGYHNYHHRFPSDYRNGIKAYHWDPTKWIVKGLARFGVTYDLRQVPSDLIIRARLKMDEKRLLKKMNRAEPVRHVPQEVIAAARARLEEAYAHARQLRVQYMKAKEARMAAVGAKLEELRAEMSRAQNRLREAANHWGTLCNRYGVRPSPVSYA